MMQNKSMRLFSQLLSITTLIWMASCTKNPPASLYSDSIGQGATPAITSVSPNDSALAGVSTVTISGTGFSPVKEYNFVNFGPKPATVLEATTTQLKVTAPIFVSDSTPVKVAVQGQELFSNAIPYKLKAAVADFGVLPNTVDDPAGMATDLAGNLYVSLSRDSARVLRITSSGIRDMAFYSPGLRNSPKAYTAMKFGPAGFLYVAVGNFRFILRIPPGGGVCTPWASTASVVYDLDFDQQQNIWTCGNDTVRAINRVRVSDRNVKPFPFRGDLRAIRVFNNYLYVGGQMEDLLWKVVRFPIISGDSLGAAETFFVISQQQGIGIYAITFSLDGDMFVGTDATAGSIVIVHPDRTSEMFYPGLLRGRIVSFAYGKDVELFASRDGETGPENGVLRINTQKQGAPYYGR